MCDAGSCTARMGGRLQDSFASRPPVFDRHVAALGVAGLAAALAPRMHVRREEVRRCGVDEPDHWRPRLLRPRRERPRDCRATEQRDELAPTAVDCHLALPWEVMPTQWSDDITLHALA